MQQSAGIADAVMQTGRRADVQRNASTSALIACAESSRAVLQGSAAHRLA